MKKLFTLSIAFFCVVAINAQGLTETGNGFLDEFIYPDSTYYEEVPYIGFEAEWGDTSIVYDGKLSWYLKDAGESAIGMWELNMDLTGHADIRFKYQFPVGTEFGIWIENNAGDGGEMFIEGDLLLGLDQMMEYTFDASAVKIDGTETPLDLSDVAEIWIMSYTGTAGTFYLDDLTIGDARRTGISPKLVESSFQVYPNPATEEFAIGVDAESVSIFNISGKEVFSVQNYQKGSSIDISELASGYYIINADSKTQKLMVK